MWYQELVEDEFNTKKEVQTLKIQWNCDKSIFLITRTDFSFQAHESLINIFRYLEFFWRQIRGLSYWSSTVEMRTHQTQTKNCIN